MSIFSQLTVLECASVLAGPAVGALFAELGARVIKLEPLNGDVTRSWKLSCEDPDTSVSAYFSSVNWGKSSVCLDLKQSRGRELAQALAYQADILIANYKPGAAERLGMDYASLSAQNPGLIYAHLTGYGADDPRTGYDALIQAESGFLYLNAHPGQTPSRMPVALIDILAAHQMKEAILVALLEKTAGAQGKYIEVSLFESALASLANQASNYLVAGQDPQPMGLEHPNIAPYGSLYTCADQQQIMLAIGSDAQFKSLCQILDCPELAENQDYKRNPDRVKHRAQLNQILQKRIQSHHSPALLARLWQADIPAGQVQGVGQALNSPLAKGLLLESGELSGLRTSPFARARTLLAPPVLGQDSASVLKEFLGVSELQFQDLCQTEVTKRPG